MTGGCLRSFAPTGTPPPEFRWAYIFTIEDSKLIYWRAELDPERARRDLGLDPA